MPLTPQHSWNQDDKSCTIQVHLSSAAGATRNTRVECTEAMVKVTCPPYFFQVDLFADVDDKNSRATVQPGVVSIKVNKMVEGMWPQLKAEGSKEAIKARREAAIAKKKVQDQKAQEDKKEKKRQDDDYVFHKQWDLERDEKRTIEHLAEVHKKEAEKELYEWVDSTEGRTNTEASAEKVETYFDTQLVEGGELDVKDGRIPLPASYHKKTARSQVLDHSLTAEPIAEFDIRKKDKGKENKELSKVEKEELKEQEEEEFREARIKAQESEKMEKKREEEKKQEEEQDRLEREKIREEQRAQKQAKEEARKAAEAAAKEAAEAEAAAKETELNVQPEQEEQPVEPEKPEKANEKKEEAQQDKPKRTGASVNRWDSEKVAANQRLIADAYYKAGFVEEAKKHELKAREAAPWVEDYRNYETAEEIQARKQREAEEERNKPSADPSIPAPRSTTKVELNFTKGRRSLPARERIETDEEVAAREEEDLRNKKMQNPDAHGPKEEQAMWLKQRGDHFYRTRDYRAAINAYTSALELQPRNSGALSNRAVCHLRLNLFADTVKDCTAAYDLLKRVKKEGKDPEEWAKEMMKRARCLLRRGMAHTRLGMLDQAVQDLDSAHNMVPDMEALKDDLEGLKESIAAHPYTKHKQVGDSAFKQGDVDSAIKAYDEALEADAGCFQALSNRAACWLAKEEYRSCIDDCSAALKLLDPTGQYNTKLALRLLVRRGTGYCWAGEFEAGRNDFKRALMLDSNNKQLREDVSMLVTTTGAASSLSEFMGTQLPDAKSQALQALDSAGVPRPPGMS